MSCSIGSRLFVSILPKYCQEIEPGNILEIWTFTKSTLIVPSVSRVLGKQKYRHKAPLLVFPEIDKCVHRSSIILQFSYKMVLKKIFFLSFLNIKTNDDMNIKRSVETIISILKDYLIVNKVMVFNVVFTSVWRWFSFFFLFRTKKPLNLPVCDKNFFSFY